MDRAGRSAQTHGRGCRKECGAALSLEGVHGKSLSAVVCQASFWLGERKYGDQGVVLSFTHYLEEETRFPAASSVELRPAEPDAWRGLRVHLCSPHPPGVGAQLRKVTPLLQWSFRRATCLSQGSPLLPSFP